jgi:glycosyltransferase involved in cell wall biosynthesis
VLLEAARAGLPAIATCTGGSPEIVSEGITGLLVPSNDVHATEMAIRRLVQEPHSRRAMGEAARMRFESEFRVERMVADYFTFWNGLRSTQP